MPQGYYLPRNEGNEAPWRWLFFDTETKTERWKDDHDIHTLDYGFALLWVRGRPSHPEQKQWFRFTDPLSFIRLVHECTATRQRLMLCAHNLQFDAAITGLLPHLTDLGYRVVYFISDYGRQLYKLVSDDRTILCVDSYNWFPYSLAQIGQQVGLPKLPRPEGNASREDQDAYCKRDVEIVQRAVEAWLQTVKEHNLGNFAPTLAGQAWNAYRHRFMPVHLLVDKDASRTQIARQSYYGGRTEAFYLGQLPPREYTLLDVNSLYPSVMRGNKYPVKWIDQDADEHGRAFQDDYSYMQMIADVLVTTDQPLYPKRHNGRLIFPIGTFRTTLAGPELMLAAMHDHLRKIYKWVAYDMARIFDDYVEFMYEQRQQHTRAGCTVKASIFKSLLNTLYGKFGQRSPTWLHVGGGIPKSYHSWDEYNGDTGEWERYRTINGDVYQEKEPVESHFAIPSIASFVTSYARVKMIELYERAGWEHVYYTDTDSLLVDQRGRTALADRIDAAGLGRLKIVHEGTEVVINGLKDYLFNGERTAAGLKKDSVELPDGSFSTYDFWGITHNWNAGIREGVVVRHYVKSLAREYAKGIVTSTGAVEPLTLAE